MAIIHASAFAYAGVGCLLVGASGSGKSSMLANAILFGAQMIADDRVRLTAKDGVLIAQAVPQLAGVLELRGMGLITHPHSATHSISLVVALEDAPAERLPEPKTVHYEGVAMPCVTLASPTSWHALPALLLYLKAMHEGRTLPNDWRPLA